MTTDAELLWWSIHRLRRGYSGTIVHLKKGVEILARSMLFHPLMKSKVYRLSDTNLGNYHTTTTHSFMKCL